MKTFNKIFYTILASLLFFSCTDLDTEPKGSTVTSEQKKQVVENNPELLQADVSGMYSLMGGQGKFSGVHSDFGYPSVCVSNDIYGADMVSLNHDYNHYSASASYADRNYSYILAEMRWYLFYYQIKAANDILESIPDDTNNKTLLHFKGQALAIRAFAYFSLVQFYQFTYKGNEDKLTIPLVEPGMNNVNNPRVTNEKIYGVILENINEAITLLEGYTRTSKAEINQQIAYGIRARINLVMNNWAEAAADADKAMLGYPLLTITKVSTPAFNSSDASSSMWVVINSPSTIRVPLAAWQSQLCSLTGRGYSTTVGSYKAINTLLWSKIPDTDVRKGWWVDTQLKSPLIDNLSWPGYSGQPIGPLAISGIKLKFVPYTAVKFGPYLNEIGNSINASDWIIMRSEEMLLIKAEGLAMSQKEGDAKSLLENYVKTYRDPNYTCSASSATELQNEIWFQRRVELWGEGFAFYDLMRLKKDMVRFNSRITTNHDEAYRFNLSSNDGWLLMRIPRKEINSNTGIPESANNNEGHLPNSGEGSSLRDGITD